MAGFGRRDWVVVLGCWVFATAYNMTKAFHIDDTAHLEIARWILDNPLHPMSGYLNWTGSPEPIFETNQPHLYFYLLAAWGAAFSFGEVSVHLFQSLFTLGAIVAFFSLARAIAPRYARWLTAFLALGPAFLVGQNVMVDTALLLVWLLFFRALLLGIDSPRQASRFARMGVWAGVGSLVKYSSLVLVAILIVCLVAERRARLWWALLIPTSMLVAWSAFNYYDVGAVHLLARPDSEFSVATNALRWVLTLGGMTPLGLMVAGLLWPRVRTWLAYAWAGTGAGLLLLVIGTLLGVPDGAGDRLLFVGFLVNGLLVIVWLVVSMLRRGLVADPRHLLGHQRRDQYLLVWVFATTAFYVGFSPAMASRHILLVIPALLLFLGTVADQLQRWTLPAGLALTLVVTAGLAISDWRFADFYRRSATAVAASIPDGATVWTSGHWGWQWYAAQEGMAQVDVERNVLAAGDYLVMAEDVTHENLMYDVETEVVARFGGGADWPSILCTARRARFYSTTQYGPWSVSDECTGRLTVLRVVDASP